MADFGVSAAAGAAAGAGGPVLQRALREMGDNPREPRVFSQARILVPVSLVCLAASLLCVWAAYGDRHDSKGWGIDGVYLTLFITALSLFMLIYGLLRRFGVDEEKVWTKFGPFFYREVRFDQLTRFYVGTRRYKLKAGHKLVNIDYDRFDYALVYLRLIEESYNHRFRLDKVDPSDPQWEKEIAIWRHIWADDTIKDYKAYYASHPDELARLQALAPDPKAES